MIPVTRQRVAREKRENKSTDLCRKFELSFWQGSPIFEVMKRHLCLAGLIASLLSTLLSAQDSPNDIAQRQEAEERYKRLNATVEDLTGANQALQKRLVSLQEDVGKLREELARATDKHRDAATQETLKQLAKAIEDVDKRRAADYEKTVAAFGALEKKVTDAVTPVKPKTASPGASSPSAKPEKGYEYTIRDRDNPTVIAAALKQQGMKITSKQIIDANPGIDWTKLRIGQKIFIPAPTP